MNETHGSIPPQNIEEYIITKFYEIKLAILKLEKGESKDLIHACFNMEEFKNIAKAAEFLKRLDPDNLEDSIIQSFSKDKSHEERKIIRKYGRHFAEKIIRLNRDDSEKSKIGTSD